MSFNHLINLIVKPTLFSKDFKIARVLYPTSYGPALHRSQVLFHFRNIVIIKMKVFLYLSVLSKLWNKWTNMLWAERLKFDYEMQSSLVWGYPQVAWEWFSNAGNICTTSERKIHQKLLSNSLTIQNGFLSPCVADWKSHMHKKLNFTSEGPELQNLPHDKNAFLLLQSLKNCSFGCCLDLHVMKFLFNNHLLRYQPCIHLCFPSLCSVSRGILGPKMWKHVTSQCCNSDIIHIHTHYHRQNLLKHPFGAFTWTLAPLSMEWYITRNTIHTLESLDWISLL